MTFEATPRFLRTLGSGPPNSLDFGVPAFSDGDDTLHIGKADGGVASFRPGLGVAAIAQQRAPRGSNGGLLLGSQWVSRPFTHVDGAFGELANGGLILPAGHYLFWGWAISLEAGTTRVRLTSPETGWACYGGSMFSNHYSLPNPIEGFCSSNGTETLMLQHHSVRAEPTPTEQNPNPWRRKSWGMGYRSWLGTDEVYASIVFTQVDDRS